MRRREVIFFTNRRSEPQLVVIEPWAMTETIPPGGRVLIEVAAAGELNFSPDISLNDDGSVEIWTGFINITGLESWQMSAGGDVRITLPDRIVTYGAAEVFNPAENLAAGIKDFNR